MTANVILGVWNASQFKRIKIENVDLESKVGNFKAEAIKQLNGNNNIELSYCGVLLEDVKPLSSYGVTTGAIIHIIQNYNSTTPITKKTLSDSEIEFCLDAFTVFSASKVFPSTIQRLAKKEVSDKIIMGVPGLSDDITAMAFVQDPDLFRLLLQKETLNKIAKEHPIMIEAINFTIAHLQKEQNTNPNQASTSTGYSYSLDALSDDDELDSDTNMSQRPLSRNASFNAITTAQLAAAIANVTNTSFHANSAGVPTTPSGSSLITNEMFSNAIQQAISTSPFGSSSAFTPPVAAPQNEENLENITRRLQPQLQQMHEMGLINDSVNVRALQATSGDVQAAIELVFNGVID